MFTMCPFPGMFRLHFVPLNMTGIAGFAGSYAKFVAVCRFEQCNAGVCFFDVFIDQMQQQGFQRVILTGKAVAHVRMPNWKKHYVADIAVSLALMFLTTIYSHSLLPKCLVEPVETSPGTETL